MGRYRIVGLPRAEKGLEVLTGDSRGKANVEAEKNETIVTTDGFSNKKQMAAIGGEKHSNGGTPLQAKEGSIIFSDSLKIKDPLILKFFNEDGKKAKTFADVSKKYDITELNKKRENPNNDKITNRSLDKSLKDSNFKLSALFTVQEFHEDKGAPSEGSSHFDQFMERMGLTPDDLFGTKDTPNTKQQEESTMRRGGMVSFSQLPKAVDGVKVGRAPRTFENAEDETPDYQFHKEVKKPPYQMKEAYGPAGVRLLNPHLKDYGIAELPENATEKQIKDKMDEVQKVALRDKNSFVQDYIFNVDKDPTKSQQPSNEYQALLKKKGVPLLKGQTVYTNEQLKEAYDNKTITQEDFDAGFNDKQWYYRMVTSDQEEVTKNQYEKMRPEIEKGVDVNGVKYVHLGDGAYRAYKIKEDGSIVEVTADPAIVDKVYEWDVKHIEDVPEDERNMDFLWSNKRSLNQARKNRNNIPYLRPLTSVADTTYTDQAYYNPDQAINAIASMTGAQGDKLAMFAPQQQQTANFLAGQQFDLMAKVIGDYADKNVDAYNREKAFNTQIANSASERLAGAVQDHHNKTTMLKQEYSNAYQKADNNVAANEIAMWEERANRLNLEATIGEQFAKDPNTGIHKFIKGRDMVADKTPTKTVADYYNDLKTELPPGTSDDVVAKLAMAHYSGKYEVQPTDPPVNEKNYQS